MTEQLFVGRPAFEPNPYTRLDPIAKLELGAWRIDNDWTKTLPNEGRAFAPRLPDFTSKCFVAFSIEPNPKLAPGARDKDQYVAVDPRRVCEVLDFRGVESELARRELVERGRDYLLPGTNTVVAALSDGNCVELKMVRHPANNTWVADTFGLGQLRTFAFDWRLFEGDQVEGHWLSVPGISVGAVTGFVDWSRDSDFLEAILKRLRKVNGLGANTPTRAQIPQIVSYLERAELLPGNGPEWRLVRERLKQFVPELQNIMQIEGEIVDFLSSLDSVQEKLREELSSRSSELEAQLKREIEERALGELEVVFDQLYRDRERLSAEVRALGQEVNAKRCELEEERVALQASRSALAAELTQLLTGLSDAPPEAEANVASLVARVGASLGEVGATFEVAAARGAPWSAPCVARSEATPWDLFDQALTSAAERWGYSAEDLRLADSAARGGRLVLLPEGKATRFLACYSEVIACGQLARHVLDPSIISLDDLWYLPGSGRHSCMARAWAAARLQPARYQLIMLDGLHRTPSAFWLEAFLEVLQDSRRPSNLLVFASLGSPEIAVERAWREPLGEVIALAPATFEGLAPRVFNQANGIAPARTCFDPVDVPLPGADEAVAFLMKLEAEVRTEQLEAALDIYRGAWVFGRERAAAIARVAVKAGHGAPPGLTSGSAWLQAVRTGGN